MAVQSMKLVNIIGDYNHLNDTIEACLDSTCYQPEATADVVNGISGFSHINDENPYAAKLQILSDAFDFAGIRPEIVPGPEKQMDDTDVESFLHVLETNFHSIQLKRSGLQKRIEEINAAIESLNHFCGMDIDLQRFTESSFVQARFGRLPVESYDKLQNFHSNPFVLFVPCSEDDGYYWGTYVVPLEQVEEVDRIFASLFFEPLELPDNTGTPAEAIVRLSKELSEKTRKLAQQNEIIENYFTNHKTECMQLYSQIKRGYDASEVRRYAARYHNAFMILGWVPEKDAGQFDKELDRVDSIEVDYTSPENSERFKPPTKLKNRGLFRLFEFFVEMYGLPNYKEVDPTGFVAITYILLYGIMFADVGQGIVLGIIGFLMYKIKKMPIGIILIPCSICSTFFGFIFGSVFGFEELLDPVYHALGWEGKPVSVMESATALLGLAVGCGVVLILIAMGINIYSSLRQRDYGRAFFGHNGAAGMVFYSSVLTLLLSMLTGFQVPTLPILVCGVLLPLVSIFFSEPLGHLVSGRRDWKPEKWGEYCMDHFFELFEILISYLSNTVSFVRIGAFVLVHAGMMMVFFALADIMGGGIAGGIMIFIGNVFVIALEGLLVGIQALRLEFYEIFSRFYIGEGTPFEPICVKAE